MNAEQHDILPARGPVFLRALFGAFGRTPIWFLCWAVTLLLAAAVAAPWVVWFSETTAHRYAPGETLGSLAETFRFDHARELGNLGGRTVQSLALLGLLTLFFQVFAAGGWLQVFLERTSGHSVRRFLWGGSRYFWRFTRVLVLTLMGLSFAGWLTHGWPWKTLVAGFLFGAPGGETEVLTSEWTAVWLGWLQSGTYALSFALLLTWGDYTRTRLALQDTRSAFLAGLSSLALLIAHPLRALRPMALIFAVEVALLWLLAEFSWGVGSGLDEGGSWHDLALLFLLTQLALILRTITRGARYHAAVAVSRALVPPLSRPDPWGARVGGPGGPQYPIDPSDDYGVSL